MEKTNVPLANVQAAAQTTNTNGVSFALSLFIAYVNYVFDFFKQLISVVR